MQWIPSFFRRKQAVFLFLTAMLSFSGLQAQSVTARLQQADSLVHHGQEIAALDVYEHILEKDSTQKTALAQASILTLRRGERQTHSKNADALYNRAKALAESALQKDPNYAPAAYAMALSLYTLSLRQGVKEKIRGLQETKDYLDRTLLLDSAYAHAWYLLGRWTMAFNKMNFAERAAVKLLFGGMPEAETSIAIADFLKCKKLEPSFIRNYYYLARAYHANGKDLTAIATLKEATHLRPVLQDDRDIQKDCQKMIEDLH